MTRGRPPPDRGPRPAPGARALTAGADAAAPGNVGVARRPSTAGVAGSTGSAGSMGVAGSTGVEGARGLAGLRGLAALATIIGIVGIVGIVGACASAPSAAAGPLEARQRWKEAQALDAAPWRERLAAFRAVRREAAPSDGYAARALLAEARVLREAAYAAAAAATEAVAANGGGRRDPDRLGHALSAARALVADEDPRGARPLLLDVVDAGGSSAPAFTGPALELLGRLASDRGDDDALARLVRRAADETPERWDTRLRLLDLVGMRALRRGARDDAERTLKAQKRLFAAARLEGEAAERVAGRAWLGLELPKHLDAR